MLILILLFTLVILFALPAIQTELIIFAKNVPSYVNTLSERANPILERLAQYMSPQDIGQIKGQLSTYMGSFLLWFLNAVIGVLTGGVIIANIVSVIVLTPVVTFYLLKDWPEVIHFLGQFVSSNKTRILFQKIDGNLRAYGRGQGIACLILVALYSLLLTLIGLDKSILIGAITGMLSAVPYLGAMIGLVISLIISIIQSDTWIQPLSVIAVFAFVAAIEGNFLTPFFIGDRIGLHPVVIIFALLSGATLFGIAGVLLALPVSAILAAIYQFYKK
jgi:predicted PurR-regulated permease PerM